MTAKLTTLKARIEQAAAKISELEHCAGLGDEYGEREVWRLQAKRHGLLLAGSYVDEMLREKS